MDAKAPHDDRGAACGLQPRAGAACQSGGRLALVERSRASALLLRADSDRWPEGRNGRTPTLRSSPMERPQSTLSCRCRSRPRTSQVGGEPTNRGRAGNSRNRPETGHSALRVPPHHHPKRPYAKRSSSACASAISGISGVGEKPSSAGARTAWASFGRPVDW